MFNLHKSLGLLLLALMLARSAFSGYPVHFFGMALPAWAARHETWKEGLSVAHLGLSWALLAAFALQIAGAVGHVVRGEARLAGRMR